MKKIRITVMRMASYPDLSAAYENPLEHACDMQLGQVFIADGWRQPLAYGGSDIYKGWMKNKKSAMVSCNDGFRPVSFYIEALEEEASDWF